MWFLNIDKYLNMDFIKLCEETYAGEEVGVVTIYQT